MEERGLEAGKLRSSVMTDAQRMDEESIKTDNASRYPDEVAVYSGLTVEQLKERYGLDTVSVDNELSPPGKREITDEALEALWLKLFTNVLLIDEFELGEDFHIFGKGAQLQDICTYFEYYHSKGVRYLCEKYATQLDRPPSYQPDS